MADDLYIKNGVIIPHQELEITASRAGGPGGQHVNKSSTRITVRWNVKETTALDDEQKKRVLKNLQAELTTEGDIILSSGASRSQQQNKKEALERLVYKVRAALHIPKKRMKTKLSLAKKETRFQEKKRWGALKKMRGKKWDA